MIRRVTKTISLPPEHAAAIEAAAAADFRGNLSALFRHLIETSEVTKSRLASSHLAT